jgi:hypothetical protein
MAFDIPHTIISKLLPKETQVRQEDWDNLIHRADQMEMDRRTSYECWTLGNGRSDEYEGTWLDQWVKNGFAQRMFPREVELVPLFHAITRPQDTIAEAPSRDGFAPVPFTAMDGEIEGVSLRELGRRVASTNLEQNDGDPTHVEIEAVSDANQALTKAEQKALRVMLERYFQRDTSIVAHLDPAAGVSVTFGAHETPHDFSSDSRTTAKYSFRRSLHELEVTAPPGSRVSWIPMRDDPSRAHDCWLSREASTADVGPDGKARFSLANLPKEADRIALYVVRDPDGANGAEVPRLVKRLQVKLPYRTFFWKFDKAQRLAALENGRP